MDRFTTIVFSISSLSDLSEFLPLFAWLLYGRREMPYFVLGIFFFLSSFIKLATLVTAELSIHNMPAYHVLACIEIVMFFCFYSNLFFNKVKWWGVIILCMLNAANTIFLQDITTFNSIAWTVNMIVLLGLGLTYLFQIYKRENDYTPLEKRPDFIITAGLLIYASGSLFTYLMGTEILSGKPQGFFHNAWLFHCIANISKNFIVSYGLWLTK
jgi:hypothetical protein